jgi:hypothetical protein
MLCSIGEEREKSGAVFYSSSCPIPVDTAIELVQEGRVWCFAEATTIVECIWKKGDEEGA